MAISGQGSEISFDEADELLGADRDFEVQVPKSPTVVVLRFCGRCWPPQQLGKRLRQACFFGDSFPWKAEKWRAPVLTPLQLDVFHDKVPRLGICEWPIRV